MNKNKTKTIEKKQINNHIPFCKPNFELLEEDYTSIRNIMTSGWVSIGKNVENFEQEFTERFHVKHAIACSCASQGLIIAMKAAGWHHKKVLLPSFTWPSTVYAIESSGNNTPIFCDIDPDTFLLDISGISPESYDVIVAVDIFGNQARVVTDKPIIYDAAHGFGMDKLGHRGIVEVVSFSFTKVVTAMEGGMILTNDDNAADIAKELRRLSSRMGEINAVVGLRQLKNYERNQNEKLLNIEEYKKLLNFSYTIQKIPYVTNHSVFSILLPNPQMRDAIAEAFRKHDIEVKTYYEPLIGGLPNTDSVFSRIISFPIYPSVKKHVKYISEIANTAVLESVEKFVQGKRYLFKSGYLPGFKEGK